MSNLIKALLRRPIAVHPIVIKAFGSAKLGILWSQFYYWSDKTSDPDGWIYKTREDLFDETGLSRKEQETARELGIKLGVLESVPMGMPRKVHFRVRMETSLKLIEQYAEKNHEAIDEDPEMREVPPDAREFFTSTEKQTLAANLLAEKGLDLEMAKNEIKKFVKYWTEPSASGKKQRWEDQKFFDLKRRLATWFNNAKKFSSKGGNKNQIGLAI